MPRVSEFDGIIILMYYDDHLPPHIHVRYVSQQALIHISTAQLNAGSLPNRIERRVIKWMGLHQAALLENWERAQKHEALMWIEP